MQGSGKTGKFILVILSGSEGSIIDLQATARPVPLWQPGGIVMRRHKLHAHPVAEVQAAGAGLADLLRDAGFVEVENGPTRYPWVGFVLGRVAGGE